MKRFLRKQNIRVYGEVKKLRVTPKILDDKIIKDGLEGLAQLNGLEQYFLVGGIAVQSYIPTSCRRPTSDIDTSILKPLNYRDFLDITKRVKEFMEDKGYSVEPRKGSRAFSLAFDSKEGDEIILEFVRRNSNNFERHKKRLYREFENTNRKIVEGRDITYSVKRPEDIAVPKLVRLINSLTRNPSFSKYIPKKLTPLDGESIREKINKITNFRLEAMHNPADLDLAENLRFVSDLYDIRILSELVGFNEQYFKLAESDWKDLRDDNKIRNKIIQVTCPLFLD